MKFSDIWRSIPLRSRIFFIVGMSFILLLQFAALYGAITAGGQS